MEVCGLDRFLLHLWRVDCQKCGAWNSYMKHHHPSRWKSLVASASGSSASVFHKQNSKRNSTEKLEAKTSWLNSWRDVDAKCCSLPCNVKFEICIHSQSCRIPRVWVLSEEWLKWHSLCNCKHLKFTGQVLLSVLQRALECARCWKVFSMAKSPAGFPPKALLQLRLPEAKKTSRALPLNGCLSLAATVHGNWAIICFLLFVIHLGSVVACPQQGGRTETLGACTDFGHVFWQCAMLNQEWGTGQ